MPDSEELHFKLLFERPTGRIVGAQAVGRGNVDKRVDVIATAIAFRSTVEQLRDLELCYAPPFGTAKDVVNMAGYVAANILHGTFRQVPVLQVRKLVQEKAFILDVREKMEWENGHVIGANHIPLSELRTRLEEVPKDQPVYIHCRSGQRSYNAVMALQNLGFENVYNISGGFLALCYEEYFLDQKLKREPILSAYNFN
jgi:rhodanese-related sulfurtransferase